MTTPAGAVAGNAAAAQREAAQRETTQPQGGGFFSRKYGPLKGWQWSLVAGGAALVYFWWRSRQKAQVTGTSVSGTGTGTGLQAEINNFYGFPPAPTPGTTTSTTGTGTGGGSKVTVPNVIGMEVDAAQRALASANLKWTRGPLKTGHGYHVTAQVPKAGAKVNPGASVALTIKQNTPGHKGTK